LNPNKMTSTHLFPILALVVILSTSLRPASQYLGSSLWAFAYAGFAIMATLAGSAIGGFLAGKSKSALTLLVVSFSTHLMSLPSGDLVFGRQFDFATWEGASYLTVFVLLFPAQIAQELLRSNPPPKIISEGPNKFASNKLLFNANQSWAFLSCSELDRNLCPILRSLLPKSRPLLLM